jgi:hypothetical protein
MPSGISQLSCLKEGSNIVIIHNKEQNDQKHLDLPKNTRGEGYIDINIEHNLGTEISINSDDGEFSDSPKCYSISIPYISELECYVSALDGSLHMIIEDER